MTLSAPLKWISRLAQRPATAWVVLVLALGLTAYSWQHFTHKAIEHAHERFQLQVEEAQQEITKRMAEYEMLLRGGAGLFDASRSVGRDEWQRYISKLDFQRHYPGLEGMGFSQLIPAAGLARHIAEVRAEGFPAYRVKPEGSRPLYAPILYLEPFDQANRRVIGYDMYSEPVRREVMERARDSGQAAASGTVTLQIQAGAQYSHKGFLMYLPIYRRDMPTDTVEQRRAALFGFVYSPFNVDGLLRGILDAQMEGLSIELYDGKAAMPVRQFYDSRGDVGVYFGDTATSRFHQSSELDIAGRAWTLIVHTLPDYAPAQTREPWIVAISGALASILLFFSLLILSRRDQQARAQARMMTAELRLSEEASRALVEPAPDAIIAIDEHGVIETCNPAAQKLTGYSSAELVGRNISLLIPGQNSKAHDAHIAQHMATGKSRIMGVGRNLQTLRKDGSLLSINLNMVGVTASDGRRRFIGFIHDLSERIQREQELAQYRNHLQDLVAERTSELAAAKAHTQLILESTADGLIGLDSTGRFSFANPAACRMLGYAQTQLLGLPVHATIHHTRADGSPFPDTECRTIDELFAGRAVRQYDTVFWRADGQPLPVAVAAQPMLQDGAIVAGVMSFTDITERKRAEQELQRFNLALQAISASNRALLQAGDETAYLDEVCRIVVDVYGYAMAWVGYAKHDARKSIRPVAHAGFDAGYLDSLQLTWDDAERGRGPTGVAIRTGQISVCRDMLHDPAFLPWRDEAIKRGYASSIVFPLLNEQEAFGALSIYSRLPDPYTAQEIQVLQELANDLAHGIVTLRLRAENARHIVAMEESEARYRTLASATFEGLVLSEQGRIVDSNKQIADMLGYTRTELLKRSVIDLFAYEDREDVMDNIDAGIDARGEHAAVRKDGSRLIVETNGRTVAYRGRPMRLTAIRDITEQKRAVEELHESMAQHRFLYEQMPQGVIYLDAVAQILDANPAAQRILGLSLAELRERDIWDRRWRVIHEDGSPFPPETHPVVEALYSGQPVSGVVMGVHSPARDDYAWINIQAVPRIPAGRRQPDQIYAVFEDITERKTNIAEITRARADAEQASRAKSAFLATMSHEIRTPMNGVLGMVEVLMRSHLSEHQTDLLRTIHDSGGVLLNLIDDILDFSKIEAGRLEIGHVPTSIADVVEDLCSSLLPLAASKEVELSLFVSPRIPEQVLADDVRLRQVLYNLIGNAIKFSAGRPERRGRVSVRADVMQSDPLRVVFSIADNGIGIAPETLRTLFSPFTQAEESTTRRFGGTGLGLAICKRLTDLMQGEIRVESAVGTGSSFSVELDFDLPAEQPPRGLPLLADVDCIVVENADYAVDDLSVYLESGGARVHRAVDLNAAAQTAAKLSAPVVVIQDAGQAQPTPALLDAMRASMPHARRLLITRGRRQRARQENPDTLTLDGNVLRRKVLLNAVAVLAGLNSPEIVLGPASEHPPGACPAPPSIAEARTQGRLILVAEDDAINQKVIRAQLGLLGYAAEIAGNGLAALNLWRSGQYALILTDLHMPEMDGYTLAKAIREEEAGERRVPIVALTANALRGEAERALAAGMDAYLTKPAPIEKLRAALETWMPLKEKTPMNQASAAPARLPAETIRARTESAVDVGVLKALVGDDDTVVRDFLSDYLDSARRLGAELRTACAADDDKQVGAIAHKLKSSSRSVGALALGELCAELENAGKAGDKQTIETDRLRFDTALAEVDACIVALLLD